MSSDKKRKACRLNAEHSTGPTSANGKAHSSSNSTTHGRYAKDFVPRGDDRKPFQQLERELREDLQPRSARQEIYFRRLVRIQWHTKQIERAILRYIETPTSDSRSNGLEPTTTHDADLIALKSDVDAACRRALAGTNSKSLATSKPRAKTIKRTVKEIDRAVLEGLAQPGQPGQLSQLLDELRKLERDFDRNLKLFLALQGDREPPDGEPA
jgi:hypothetical protein